MDQIDDTRCDNRDAGEVLTSCEGADQTEYNRLAKALFTRILKVSILDDYV